MSGPYGALFTETLQTKLASSDEIALVERAQLEKAVGELKLEASGITAPSSMSQLGSYVNARYLLLGSSLEAPGGLLQVSVRLVEASTGQVVRGVAAKCLIDPSDAHGWETRINTMGDTLLVALRAAGLSSRAPQSTADPVDTRLPDVTPPSAPVSIRTRRRPPTTTILRRLKRRRPSRYSRRKAPVHS